MWRSWLIAGNASEILVRLTNEIVYINSAMGMMRSQRSCDAKPEVTFKLLSRRRIYARVGPLLQLKPGDPKLFPPEIRAADYGPEFRINY